LAIFSDGGASGVGDVGDGGACVGGSCGACSADGVCDDGVAGCLTRGVCGGAAGGPSRSSSTISAMVVNPSELSCPPLRSGLSAMVVESKPDLKLPSALFWFRKAAARDGGSGVDTSGVGGVGVGGACIGGVGSACGANGVCDFACGGASCFTRGVCGSVAGDPSRSSSTSSAMVVESKPYVELSTAPLMFPVRQTPSLLLIWRYCSLPLPLGRFAPLSLEASRAASCCSKALKRLSGTRFTQLPATYGPRPPRAARSWSSASHAVAAAPARDGGSGVGASGVGHVGDCGAGDDGIGSACGAGGAWDCGCGGTGCFARGVCGGVLYQQRDGR